MLGSYPFANFILVPPQLVGCFAMIDKSQEKVKRSAEMLRLLRETLGMTQKEIADELGIAEYTVWRAENQKNEIKFSFYQVKRLFALMARANIPIERLPDEPEQPSTG
ncbi:MAG TPA: hypothetical protein DEG17_03405 [Cyanobacteria bacterium UBA11149]|nr:hypothetical protein [Cyanobacteria bacterium UBA11367]HBE61068.1 hypothetical protein [Cyanobacteria bacterium UBA11366]HBK62269.1 hypothetical protein [Cyanobacteria bacterium UBA11166]HBR74253.1 hypothetical protein [Cyanobacteria bacterium UBA11159]HBS69851.1 hypothetical protein [Cyanobacteria bacterium UBA11153]HBW87954.1 hypothetical protein [Cyanobacteria bacterium UBA11149]